MTVQKLFPPTVAELETLEAKVEAMHELEAECIELLSGEELLAPIFERKRSGRSRTRAYLIERIEDALKKAADEQLTTRAVRRSREMFEVATTIRWQIALSGKSVARHEARRHARHGAMSYEDLMQEAILGLVDAARRFELSKKVKFTTYARWWVRAKLTRAIDRSPVVRLGGSAIEELRNVKKAVSRSEGCGLDWTPTTIADELGLTPERVRWLLDVQKEVSLDVTVDTDEGEGARRLDLIASDAPSPSEDTALTRELSRLAEAKERCLTDRQQFILAHRYGLGDAPKTTLVALADELDLSRERVRQLEKEALRLLRQDGRIRDERAKVAA